jgi:hypothetical protein
MIAAPYDDRARRASPLHKDVVAPTGCSKSRLFARESRLDGLTSRPRPTSRHRAAGAPAKPFILPGACAPNRCVYPAASWCRGEACLALRCPVQRSRRGPRSMCKGYFGSVRRPRREKRSLPRTPSPKNILHWAAPVGRRLQGACLDPEVKQIFVACCGRRAMRHSLQTSHTSGSLSAAKRRGRPEEPRRRRP